MSNMPLVSIIINNYNYGRFLREAIESALNQTYPNIEVIVVDDGSTDNSREIIAEYGDRIIPVLKENGGQASAFNAGFAVSRGEIVCFLDSDDVFMENKVEKVVDVFYREPDIGWVFHPLQYITASGEFANIPIQIKQVGKWDVTKEAKKGKIKLFLHATSGLCFKRKLLNKILPMPEEIRITADNYIKFASALLMPGVLMAEPLAFQRLHGSNAYTFRKGRDKSALEGEIHIFTAFHLKERYSEARLFSLRLMARSLAIWKNAQVGDSSFYKNTIITDTVKKFVSDFTVKEKKEFFLRFLYHCLRLKVKYYFNLK